MQQDLTQGSIRAGLIRFSLPLIAGNLLQQLYNVADTLIVGRFLGNVALAAVGSAFSLMILLTSLVLGLCMGSGVVFSQLYGEGNMDKLKTAMTNAFCLIAALSLLLTALSYALLDAFIVLLRVPPEAVPDITSYLRVIFAGIFFTFLYNFFAAALRSVGNSFASLLFLLLSTVVNIALDLLFVLVLRRGVAGAALATVIAQGLSAAGIALYFFFRLSELRPRRSNFRLDRPLLSRIASVSVLTSVQQSIMNFGILLIQRLVDSFGPVTMAAFAAAVKIDTFAYLPVQDFGNAFSVFVAQNYGAGQRQRIKKGIKQSVVSVIIFCVCISAVVCGFAGTFMGIFVDNSSVDVINAGAVYLRMEGTFYIGIGILFMLYGYYRAINKPMMSVVLTVISLGTRVVLAYTLSGISAIGVIGIWVAIPIGWFLADAAGIIYYIFKAGKSHI